MLGDLSRVQKIYIITGRTDMRKSIDGLMAIIRDTYEMNPYANAVFLFCGRSRDKIKALHFEKTGFVFTKGLITVASSNGLAMKLKLELYHDKNFAG